MKLPFQHRGCHVYWQYRASFGVSAGTACCDVGEQKGACYSPTDQQQWRPTSSYESRSQSSHR